MKKVIAFYILVSISSQAQQMFPAQALQDKWNAEAKINNQFNDPMNMRPNASLRKTSNSPRYNLIYKKVQQHNSVKGNDPIGDKKYHIMSQQQGITPVQACMLSEVSCQANLKKKMNCTTDKGDGRIECNGIVYKLDHSINNLSRSSKSQKSISHVDNPNYLRQTSEKDPIEVTYPQERPSSSVEK